MNKADYWRDLAIDTAETLPVKKGTRLPTPADVAGALGEDWTAEAREEYRKRFSALYDLVQVKVPTESEYPDLLPETEPDHPGEPWQYLGRGYGVRMNGLPVGDWLPDADGEIDKRLSSGLQILHLNLLADGKGFPIPTRGAQEHYHPDPNHPQQGNVHFEISADRKDAVTAWAAWLAVLTDGFEAVHQVWERVDPDTRNAAGLKHPLAALIEGWLIGPPVEADERETGILPATLASVRDADDPASLFDLGEREKVSGFTPHPIEQAYLPGLTLVGNEIVPAMPLLMWDASTEGGPRRGKGAPLPLRIWIEAVLALPTHERFSPRRVAVRYGDLTGWLMPNGEYRQRDFPAIQGALHRVHNLRLPWELPDGTGGSRAIVVVRDMPRVWNAYDDMVTFEISLPPGINAQGPIVYRPALRRLGQQSAMRYRAELGLCWLWDRYGARNGRYIQPTRPRFARDDQDRLIDARKALLLNKDGQPARTYMVSVKRNGKPERILRPGIVPLDAEGRPVPLADAAHERNPAADRYPVLTPTQLVELCYPLNLTRKRLTPSARSMRRERAQSALMIMAEKGYCIIEDIDSGWRILPPKGWGARYSE